MSFIKVLEVLIGTITPIIGYAFGIGSYFYYNKISCFIFFNKLFKAKKDVNFKLTCNFNGEIENIKLLKSLFKEYTNNTFRIVTSSEKKEVFRLDDMLITIIQEEIPDVEYKYTIIIENINSTYRLAEKNLKLLEKIFSKIDKNITIDEWRYAFESDFKKNNPFLSNSITKVGIDQVKNFYMVLSISAFTKQSIQDEDIQINKNTASYITDNFSDIRDIASIILAI